MNAILKHSEPTDMELIRAHIEHMVRTENHWTVHGALNDYLVVSDRNEAYMLLDALDSYENASSVVGKTEGAQIIANWMRSKLKAAYLNDARETYDESL